MHRIILTLIIASVVFFGFWIINLPIWLSGLFGLLAGLSSLLFKSDHGDHDQKDLMKEVMSLTGHYTAKLKKVLLRITATKTKAYIEELIRLLGEIVKTVKDDPKDAKPASKFLNYYGEVACKLADAYVQLSKIDLYTKEIVDAKVKIDESLGKLVSACKNHIVNLHEDNLLEIDTELKVLELSLKNDF